MKDADPPAAPPADAPVDSLAASFGPLARVLFDDAPLAPAWRMSFLANVFTGPVYARLQTLHGFGRPGFVLLYCLSVQEGLVAQDVVRVSGLPKNSVSRAVADLVNRGLVVRQQSTADRRSRPLHLTPAGVAVLSDGMTLFQARQDRLLAALDPAERDALHSALARLAENMAPWAHDP